MDFLKQNIWVVVLGGILFSFLFPAIGILASPLLEPLFMVLMFMSTLDIKIKEVMQDIRKPGKIIMTLLIIHLVSPLIVLVFKPFISADIFLGLIIATVVPSGVSVVFLSKLFGGEPSRSLVVTTASNLLSPLVVPLLVLIFAGQAINVSPIAMSLTIIKLIIIPFIAAQFVAQTSWKKKLSKYMTETLLIILGLIIIGIISPVRNFILDDLMLALTLAAFVALLNIIDFFLGYSIGRPIESKISYGVSASFKNFALATLLSLSLFTTVVALPAIMYAVINSFLLIPLQWFVEGQKMEAKAYKKK